MQRRARLCAIGGVGDAFKSQSQPCFFDRFTDHRQSGGRFVEIKPMVDNPCKSPVMVVDLASRKNDHASGKGHGLHPLDHQDQRRAAFRIIAEDDHGGGGGRGRHDFAGDGVDQYFFRHRRLCSMENGFCQGIIFSRRVFVGCTL